MSRGTQALLVVGRGTMRVPSVTCDRCGGWAGVLDQTDVPRGWAARVVGAAVRHYCPGCDPGPSVGKGTGRRRG